MRVATLSLQKPLFHWIIGERNGYYIPACGGRPMSCKRAIITVTPSPAAVPMCAHCVKKIG